MNESLFNSTKVAAYFLWEYTEHDNALSLWYCAEDIAYFFERKEYFHFNDLLDIILRDTKDMKRVNFTRHIAFRIYIYTRNSDRIKNWFIAERLLNNQEWAESVCSIATIYHENKTNFSKLVGVRSEQVKQYYKDLN